MLASVVLPILSLIAVQAFLVVKVSDWLSTFDGHVQSDSRDFTERSAGRFISAA